MTSAPEFSPSGMWERNLLLLGEEKFKRLQQATVTIIGVGGVGSQAVHVLARSGIGNIRIMDAKDIEPSALNRHVCATWADVGRSKVEVLATFLKKVNPLCNIVAVKDFFVAERHGATFITGSDYVIDCIDDVKTKVGLLEYCANNGIPVISCMAAATRVDPRHVVVGEISTTRNDPLSIHVRKELTKRGVNLSQITCVYSVEPPVEGLVKLTKEEQDQLKEKAAARKKSDEELKKGENTEETDEAVIQESIATTPTSPSPSPSPSDSLPTQPSRVRILPSSMVIPTLIGVSAAGEVLMALSSFAHRHENALSARHRGRSLAVTSAERERQTCVALARASGVEPPKEALQEYWVKREQRREEWRRKRKEDKEGKEEIEEEKSQTPASSPAAYSPAASSASVPSHPPFYIHPATDWLTPNVGDILISKKAWGGQSALTPVFPLAKEKQLASGEAKVENESPRPSPSPSKSIQGPLVLMRWDCSLPFSATNAVLMTAQEAKQLMTSCFLQGIPKADVFGAQIVERVDKILKEAIPALITEL